MIVHKTIKPIDYEKDINDKINKAIHEEKKKCESEQPVLKKIKISDIKNDEMRFFYNEGYSAKTVDFENDFIVNILDFLKSYKTNNNLNNSSTISETSLPKDINLRKYIDDNFGTVLNQCFENGYNFYFMFHDASDKTINFNFGRDDLDHVTFAHVDTCPPRLKIMLYLNYKDGITVDNGCFQVIPGSHLVNYENNFNMNMATYRTMSEFGFLNNYKEFFEKIDERFQKKNMFMLQYDKDEEYYKYIKENLKPLPTPNNMILFCPDIIHSGGFIYKGVRKALQICMY